MAARTLRTERLVLRPWREEDFEPFVRLNADAVVMEHFPAPLDRAQSDALGRRIQTGIERDGYGLWAVEAPEIPFAGYVGLAAPRFEAHFTPAVEVGWRLAREAWGRGWATEGARAAIAYGFDTLGLPEIVSFTAPQNTRSRRVMEKLGMSHDPADDFDHPAMLEDDRLRRHVLYRLRP